MQCFYQKISVIFADMYAGVFDRHLPVNWVSAIISPSRTDANSIIGGFSKFFKNFKPWLATVGNCHGGI